MKKHFAFFIIIISLFFGCASSYNSYGVDTIKDEFDGYTIKRMHGNIIFDNSFLPNNIVCFNPQSFTDIKGNINYQLYIEYSGKEWLFIEPGETLVLLVNGKRIGLNGYGSRDHRIVLDNHPEMKVREIVVFEATKEILKNIANANTVKFKLVGASRDVQMELTSEQINNFLKFVVYLNI